jgi:hypothetical protein
VLYRALPGTIDDTARWMASIAADWDRRLHAIREIAEDGPHPPRRDRADQSREDDHHDR